MQPDDEALWMRYVEERAIFEKMRKLFRTFFLVVLCFGAVTCIAIIPKACSELGPGGILAPIAIVPSILGCAFLFGTIPAGFI